MEILTVVLFCWIYCNASDEHWWISSSAGNIVAAVICWGTSLEADAIPASDEHWWISLSAGKLVPSVRWRTYPSCDTLRRS